MRACRRRATVAAVAESSPDSNILTFLRRRSSLPAYELKLPWVVIKSVTFVRGWVKVADSSSDDGNIMEGEESSNTLLHAQRKENGDYNLLVR